MKFYIDLEKRKDMVRNYLRQNPRATFREIKNNLHTKINKVYSGGMEEAYTDANLASPRTFKRMSRDEKRNALILYVKEHPLAGGHTIRKDTKINFQTIFKNAREIYKAAGLTYPREERSKLMSRDKESKREEILELLRKDPLLGIEEIGRTVKTHPYSLFKNVREMYTLANVPYFASTRKRKLKKKIKVINFIKSNHFATQREINKHCKTHVQLIFERGIFDAYKEAKVKYPYERLKLHGTAIKEIKDSSILFEKSVAEVLSGYGCVIDLSDDYITVPQ